MEVGAESSSLLTRSVARLMSAPTRRGVCCYAVLPSMFLFLFAISLRYVLMLHNIPEEEASSWTLQLIDLAWPLTAHLVALSPSPSSKRQHTARTPESHLSTEPFAATKRERVSHKRASAGGLRSLTAAL